MKLLLHTLALLLVVPILLICLPVILPYLYINGKIESRRLRRAAAVFHCPVCDALLGDAALKLSDQEWLDHLQKLQKKFPGMRFRNRMFRAHNAICPNCRAPFRFKSDSRTFVPLPAKEKAILEDSD